MTTPKGAYVKVRLMPEQRTRLTELSRATGQKQHSLLERAIELVLSDPDLHRQTVVRLRAEVAALREELAASQRKVEQLTTRLQTDWQAAIQARAEERRARVAGDQEQPARSRWPRFWRREG